MGASINFNNRIHISSHHHDTLLQYDYKELSEEFIANILTNDKIEYIQISQSLPKEVFLKIDNILMQRPDLTFRIFGLHGCEIFDLNILKEMPHLTRLQIDYIGTAEKLNCGVLGELTELRYLKLEVFDLKDYSFIQNLPEELKELHVFADTMKGSVNFDCKWLLKFQNLHTLSLGKKAKKNIAEISKIKSIKKLLMRGIKLPDLKFLHNMELESFLFFYCGMNDLSSLSGLDTLKYLYLWRIMKLEDISFVQTLKGLETLHLADLKHITALPDLSGLENLKEIILQNVPIKDGSIPEELKPIVTRYY